jgi:hypothetical protein
VHPRDIEKTAIITPFGLYEFMRMPFGLRNAGQTFQRLMDSILHDLSGVFVYMDDVLVASKSRPQHIQDVRAVFQRLKENGLIIRPEKCLFGQTSLDFLGHRLCGEGVRPLPGKVKAVQHFPRPDTVKQLRRFLGMVNYYHRFIPHAAARLQPLNEQCSNATPSKKIAWTTESSSAFMDARDILAQASMLAHPLQNTPFILSSDASDVGVGGVLEQYQDGRLRPLSFFSRKLSPAESRHSAFDKELLAAYLSVRHFQPIIEGRVCTLMTDHRPLALAWNKQSDPWSARQQRHLSAIAQYVTDVCHRSGASNTVADCLSRAQTTQVSMASNLQEAARDVQCPSDNINAVVDDRSHNPLDNVSLGIDYAALAASQGSCLTVRDFRTAVSGLRLAEVPVMQGGSPMLCDVSRKHPRPVVPDDFPKKSLHLPAQPRPPRWTRYSASDWAFFRLAPDEEGYRTVVPRVC